MNNKTFIWTIAFILLVSIVYSYEINTLYNGNDAQNYSINIHHGNVTGYLYLKMYTNVTNATLNITSLSALSFDIPNHNAKNVIYDFDNNNYDDDNFATYSYADPPDIDGGAEYDMGVAIWNYTWVNDYSYNYTNTYLRVLDGAGDEIVNISEACSIYAKSVGNLSIMVKSFEKITTATYYIEWRCKKQAGTNMDMANWDTMRNGTGSRAVYEHLLTYRNGSVITNPEMEIGEFDGTPEFSPAGVYSGTTQLDFTSIANSVIDAGCNCTNCTISGQECVLPFLLHSDTASSLQIDTISTLYNFTFVINIKNQTNGVLLNNVPISVGLISDTYSKNYTTTSGIIEDMIVPENYTIRYSAPRYNERTAYKDLSEGQNTTFDLYLLYDLGTGATNVTATVYDAYGSIVDGVRIDYYKYDIATNDYIFVGTGTTNFEGEAQLYLTLNDEYYKFYLYYPPTNLVRITTPTYITDTNLVFQIEIEEDATDQIFDVSGILYTLSYNNSQFKLVYDDTESIGDEFCLYAYKVTMLEQQQLNYSCSSLGSSTITADLNLVNGTTYLGKAFVRVGSTMYLLGTKGHTQQAGNPLKNNILGLFIVFVLIVIFTFIMRSLVLSLILLPVPLIMGSIMGLIAIPVSYGIILEIMMIIIVIIIKN